MSRVCIVIVTIEKDENESYWFELWFHEIFRRVLRNMDILWTHYDEGMDMNNNI